MSSPRDIFSHPPPPLPLGGVILAGGDATKQVTSLNLIWLHLDRALLTALPPRNNLRCSSHKRAPGFYPPPSPLCCCDDWISELCFAARFQFDKVPPPAPPSKWMQIRTKLPKLFNTPPKYHSPLQPFLCKVLKHFQWVTGFGAN